MFDEITHNLEVAKPNFEFYIRNIKPELSRWIQYKGVTSDGSRLFFNFKSSQTSLSFSVYAGVNINNTLEKLQANSNEIYDYFKDLKYNIIYKP